MSKFFESIPYVRYEGRDSKNPMAFRYYDPNEIVNGKPMREHLKFAMAYWHTMCAEGTDMFGVGTIDKSYSACDPMEIAKNKAMNSINSQFYEHGLDVNVYNFFLKEESTADIDVYCTIGDLSSFFEKLVKTQNEDLNSLAVSAIHNVFSEVPDAVKSKIINRLFKESNGEICRLLSDYISKKFFRIKIDSIDFHMSDI